MTLLSNIILRDITANRPAAGVTGRLFFDTTLGKLQRDNGSTWQDVESTTATGAVATDAIFDAKGDLPVGTGADTAAKLTVGANGKVPVADSAQTTGLKYAFPPGYEFDYVERTTNLTVTATVEASADTFIDGTAVTYDGSTRIIVEFFTADGQITSGQALVVTLWDGSTDLGRLVEFDGLGGVGATPKRFLTPSAAAHTYHIKAWKTGGTATILGGAGGIGAYMPAFMRITKA